MAILIKSKDNYYEISDKVLEKCKISKKDFEKSQKENSADVAGQCGCDYVVDLTTCCMDKLSYFLSCPKK